MVLICIGSKKAMDAVLETMEEELSSNEAVNQLRATLLSRRKNRKVNKLSFLIIASTV